MYLDMCVGMYLDMWVQTSQPFFHAIVRFSQIWHEIHTLWRETWDNVIIKSCFR